jgi:hypothetical protein
MIGMKNGPHTKADENGKINYKVTSSYGELV